jgi:Protein of unknown function (DUF402)
MWSEGDVIRRREIRNDGRSWAEIDVVVVRDEPELLATYIPTGAPFTFPPYPEPHPWAGRAAWQGHETLMLHRPGDSYAVWHFWDGPERAFACWYLNLQEPFRRTDTGYDTQDLELDLVLYPDGRLVVKDDELLDERVRDGRFTQDQVDAIRAEGERLRRELETDGPWWDPDWSRWSPPRPAR